MMSMGEVLYPYGTTILTTFLITQMVSQKIGLFLFCVNVSKSTVSPDLVNNVGYI